MNNLMFSIYLKTNRLKKMSPKDLKNLTVDQINTIIGGNYAEQLSDRQLNTIDLEKFMDSYDMFVYNADGRSVNNPNNPNLVKLLIRLNRNDIIEKNYIYSFVYENDEISFEEKWKLFSENQMKAKTTSSFDKENAIVYMSEHNEKELIERIRKDEQFRKKFFTEIANCNKALIRVSENVQDEICSNEEFNQQFINPNFLCKICNRTNFKIFENIPQDKKHLLAFYEYNEKGNKKETEKNKVQFKKLLQKNYDGILNESEIDELINLHEDYDSSYVANVVVNQRNKEYELVSNILEELSTNPDYYKEIKQISEKFCDGNIKKAALFSQRYKTETIRQELLGLEQIAPEDLSKIDYVLDTEKKVEIESLKDLKLYSLDELKKMPVRGDKTEVAYLGIKGTPDSGKYKRIFNHNREIVMINQDGTVQSEEAPTDHYATLKSMLKDSKIDIEDCENAFDVGVKVAKSAKTICMAAENSSVMIYFPKEITEAQKEQYVEIMKKVKNIDDITISCLILDEDNITSIDKYSMPDLMPSEMYSEEFINQYFDVKPQVRDGINGLAKECISEYSISSSELIDFEKHRQNLDKSRDAQKKLLMEGNDKYGRDVC